MYTFIIGLVCGLLNAFYMAATPTLGAFGLGFLVGAATWIGVWISVIVLMVVIAAICDSSSKRK